MRRFQWLSGLKRGSAAARLLGLRVRTSSGGGGGHGCLVFCECCMLSSRGLCDGPIPRPEESYRLFRVIMCDAQISRMRRPWLALGRWARERERERRKYACENGESCSRNPSVSRNIVWIPQIWSVISLIRRTLIRMTFLQAELRTTKQGVLNYTPWRQNISICLWYAAICNGLGCVSKSRTFVGLMLAFYM